MKNIALLVGIIGSYFGTALLIIAILTYPTMLIWNWLIPDIFGLREITFLEALGLMVLGRLLFTNAPSSNSSN